MAIWKITKEQYKRLGHEKKLYVGNINDIEIHIELEDDNKTKMEEDYEDFGEDLEEYDGLILSIGEDGKASIRKPEDYVEMRKEEAELVKDFIDANKEMFDAFIKKINREHENG